MKILFLVPYPVNESPSQRFRFEQYFGILDKHGYSFEIQSFLNTESWRLFFKPGKPLVKFTALVKGFFKRVLVLGTVYKFDFVFIHREAAPLGPPAFEWVIARLFRKKIIYDFDDAIWLTDRKDESLLFRFLKWRSKVKSICRWSHKISCGNEFLATYARQFNNCVIVNPTTIDTQKLHDPLYYERSVPPGHFIVGWTGSHSTLKYLKGLENVLREIEDEYPFVKVMVIADQKPDLKLKSLIFKPWSIKTEIQDLIDFNIGIMPLPQDEWSRGKCGFKALQYMALEIPAVVSPVGANLEIIENTKSGLFASTATEWKERIIQLIREPDLARRIGTTGRERVEKRYSVLSNTEVFLSLFE